MSDKRGGSVCVFDDAVIVLVVDDDPVGIQFVGLLGGSQQIVFFDAWALTAKDRNDKRPVGTESRDLEWVLHFLLIHIYLHFFIDIGLVLVRF